MCEAYNDQSSSETSAKCPGIYVGGINNISADNKKDAEELCLDEDYFDQYGTTTLNPNSYVTYNITCCECHWDMGAIFGIDDEPAPVEATIE